MGLWRIRATVDDRPGYLSVLTASLALRAVNILAVQVHTTEGGAVDDFLVDAPDSMTERDLLAAVEKGRGRDPWVAPAEAQALADAPTRALGLAARLVRDPDSLGAALGAMLGATEVTWRAQPTRHGSTPAVMRLTDPAGGVFEITRHEPAFTPAEFARAQALVDVATATMRVADEPAALLLPGGDEVLLRRAVPDDLDALRDLATARVTVTPGPGGIGRLLDPARASSLVAVAGDRIVGLAGYVTEGDIAEVALLVLEAWRGHGIGTALLRRLVGQAGRAGLAALVVHVRAGDDSVLEALHRLTPEPGAERDGEVVTVTLPIASRTQVAG